MGRPLSWLGILRIPIALSRVFAIVTGIKQAWIALSSLRSTRQNHRPMASKSSFIALVPNEVVFLYDILFFSSITSFTISDHSTLQDGL
jgi:hypothetical protein